MDQGYSSDPDFEIEPMDYELVLPEDEVEKGPAPLKLRLAAFAIDIVAASIILILPFTAALMMSMGVQTADPLALEDFIFESPHLLAVFDMSSFFILLFYFSLFESSSGQTIGKRMLDLNVGVGSGEHGPGQERGDELSFGKAVVRNIPKAAVFSFLSIPFLSSIVFIDLFGFLFRGDRLFSDIAGTKVLYEPKLDEGLRWTQEL